MEQERSLVEGEACIRRFHDCDDVCCHVGDVDDFAAAGKDADRHRNARLAVELRDDHQIEDASPDETVALGDSREGSQNLEKKPIRPKFSPNFGKNRPIFGQGLVPVETAS
jgi:hypothetical protein